MNRLTLKESLTVLLHRTVVMRQIRQYCANKPELLEISKLTGQAFCMGPDENALSSLLAEMEIAEQESAIAPQSSTIGKENLAELMRVWSELESDRCKSETLDDEFVHYSAPVSDSISRSLVTVKGGRAIPDYADLQRALQFAAISRGLQVELWSGKLGWIAGLNCGNGLSRCGTNPEAAIALLLAYLEYLKAGAKQLENA